MSFLGILEISRSSLSRARDLYQNEAWNDLLKHQQQQQLPVQLAAPRGAQKHRTQKKDAEAFSQVDRGEEKQSKKTGAGRKTYSQLNAPQAISQVARPPSEFPPGTVGTDTYGGAGA